MNEHVTIGRTIQIFLVDGSPTGLRKATVHGWTGTVLVSSSAAFPSLIAREELDRTGVYLLAGLDPDTDEPRVYIGSANSVVERIRQSAQQRTFWQTAFAVVTSDDDLSKGHAEYLEARLIEMTAEADRALLDNGTKPDTDRRRLPEADKANMEQFLLNLGLVLPVVGLDILRPQPRAVRHSARETQQPAEEQVRFEITHRTGIRALAVEEGGEFAVLAGSEVLTGTGNASSDLFEGRKQRLMERGVLVAQSEGVLRFAKTHAFSSPSTAAAIVLDRSSNGRTEWKVEGTRQTYHDWQQSQVAEAAE